MRLVTGSQCVRVSEVAVTGCVFFSGPTDDGEEEMEEDTVTNGS